MQMRSKYEKPTPLGFMRLKRGKLAMINDQQEKTYKDRDAQKCEMHPAAACIDAWVSVGVRSLAISRGSHF